MRIVSVTRIKNEIDVVEAFLRHTAAFVDRMVVVDNGSFDGTRDVLGLLAAEGLPVEIDDDPEPSYVQAARMTEAMRRAVAECGADWVVPLDADELILAPDRAAFRAALAAAGGPRRVSWRHYVPTAEDDAREPNPALRIRHRLRAEAHPFSKVIVPAELARRPGAALTTGSHSLVVDGEEVFGEPIGDAVFAHFAVRSPTQYAKKILQGYLGFIANPALPPSAGVQYRAGFRELVERPGELERHFHTAALHFPMRGPDGYEPELVLDPFPYAGGPLVHTRVESGWQDVYAAALRLGETYALAYAEAQRRGAAPPGEPGAA